MNSRNIFRCLNFPSSPQSPNFGKSLPDVALAPRSYFHGGDRDTSLFEAETPHPGPVLANPLNRLVLMSQRPWGQQLWSREVTGPSDKARPMPTPGHWEEFTGETGICANPQDPQAGDIRTPGSAGTGRTQGHSSSPPLGSCSLQEGPPDTVHSPVSLAPGTRGHL